eukprot:TRINITY_DN28942_c0_g1_i1.p1 TRINITY_DN28942_c0_g1~~TRINITY_DN28942_c0_g1_i1.p1  ORF type:complete len:634 (+),score=49.91 TRINITY_DN28942_c0_g1_i1:75-1976(+)
MPVMLTLYTAMCTGLSMTHTCRNINAGGTCSFVVETGVRGKVTVTRMSIGGVSRTMGQSPGSDADWEVRFCGGSFVEKCRDSGNIFNACRCTQNYELTCGHSSSCNANPIGSCMPHVLDCDASKVSDITVHGTNQDNNILKPTWTSLEITIEYDILPYPTPTVTLPTPSATETASMTVSETVSASLTSTLSMTRTVSETGTRSGTMSTSSTATETIEQRKTTDTEIPSQPTPTATTTSTATVSITEVVDTPAPSRPTVDRGILVRPIQEIDVLSGIGVVLGGLGGSSGGVRSAGTAVVVMMECNLNGGAKLPFILHPTQATIEGSAYLAVVVYNILICIGVVFLGKITVQLSRRVTSSDPQAFARFPSIPFLFTSFLYQGVCYGATALAIHPLHPYSTPVGVLGLLLALLVPLYVFRSIHVIDNDAFYAPLKRNLMERVVLGDGEWVSRSPMAHIAFRYTSLLRGYKQGLIWFSGVEILQGMAQAAIHSLQVSNYTGCGHVKLASTVITLIVLSLESYLWPRARHRDGASNFILLGLQAAYSLLAAITYYTHTTDRLLEAVSQHISRFMLCLLITVSACDLFSEIYLFATSQRNDLQAEVWNTSRCSESLLEMTTLNLYEELPACTDDTDILL